MPFGIFDRYIRFGINPNEVNSRDIPADYTPTNYTPTQVSSEGNDKISAHLKGINDALYSIINGGNSFDKYFVDGEYGNDLTADGSILKPFKTIQACLDMIGQPVNRTDAMRTIHIFVSDKLSATPGYSPQTFNGCYNENLIVPSRKITIIGCGVKIGSNGAEPPLGNILKEYSSSRRFGASSSELRPCLTFVGLANSKDSHQRLRNGFHVGGKCRTAILQRNFDFIQGNGSNKITVHIAPGQYKYPITISNYPTEPYIRIKVNGTTNYNATYDITAKIDEYTFEATRISGTNPATNIETSGNFFESDSAGASGLSHDSCFINTYMQGEYTCDDGTINGGAPTAGTEVLYSFGSRFYTGVQGRTILMQRFEDTNLSNVAIQAGNFIIGAVYTIASIGTTDFTLIGASSNTVGVVFTATGVGSGTGTAVFNHYVNSIATMFNSFISGPLNTATFTYTTDDMGFMDCKFNTNTVFTVRNTGQTLRIDSLSLTSFLTNGGSFSTNTPTIAYLDQDLAIKNNSNVSGATVRDALNTLNSKIYSYTYKTANYTATTNDHVIECYGILTITLYTAVGNTGKELIIKNSSPHTVTIQANGIELIDDTNTKTLTSIYQSLRIVSNGIKWLVI